MLRWTVHLLCRIATLGSLAIPALPAGGAVEIDAEWSGAKG